jgi:copper chaperone CopZ
METIKVCNLKCGGCEQSVKRALAKNGFKNIEVNIVEQLISFEGDEILAKEILSQMGYPEAGSAAAKSLGKKAKSYFSCAIGRVIK